MDICKKVKKLFRWKIPQIQYEIWAADFFDYRDVEWDRYAVYTDKEQAETELQKLRQEAGGEHRSRFPQTKSVRKTCGKQQ